MSKTLNIIPENPFLVIIGLNPTEEAIANKAVFSRDNAFWNILTKAGLIKDVSVSGVKLCDVPLKDRAIEVFEKQNFKLNGYTAGFADLLPLVSEKFSKKVNIPLGSTIDLFKSSPNLQNAKKIVLMGQKVVDGFAQDYKSLKKWRDMPLNSNGSKSYGHIGNIVVNGNVIQVYAMPFPVNNNIKNKHIIYNSVLNANNAI